MRRLSRFSSGCSENGMVFVDFARCPTNTHTRPPVFFAVPKLGAGVCIDLIVALCIVMLRCFNHERAERFGM